MLKAFKKSDLRWRLKIAVYIYTQTISVMKAAVRQLVDSDKDVYSPQNI